MSRSGIFLATLLAGVLSSTVFAAQDVDKRGLNVQWPISDAVASSIVTFRTAGDDTFRGNLRDPVDVPARFNLPKSASPAGKVPAVIYVHGNAGVDGRGAFNAFALNAAGIATLEMDMFTARGLAPGDNNGGKLQPTEPFVYGAFLFLSKQPAIDASRIGIEGETGLVLQMASPSYLRAHTSGDVHFAAHLSFYPNCTNLTDNSDLKSVTGAPIHILLGDRDEDSSVMDCETVARQIGAGITVYKGATHQWDEQFGHAFRFRDNFANRGQGGFVRVVPSAKTAEESRSFAVNFFRQAFGMH